MKDLPREMVSFLIIGVLSALLNLCILQPTVASVSSELPPLRDDLSNPLVELRHHHDLKIDEAGLTILNRIEEDLTLYTQYDMCDKCLLLPAGNVTSDKNASFALNTWSPSRIHVAQRQNKSITICSFHKSLIQYGKYEIYVEYNKTKDNIWCNFVQTNSPEDPNIPIYIAMGVFFGMAILFSLIKALNRRNCFRRLQCLMPTQYHYLINDDLGSPGGGAVGTESEEALPPPPVKKRLRSLDTFRGLSLVIMIFVNYKGGRYWFFHHARWNGLTVADLVFPWFTFIMGTSIALAFRGALRRGCSRRDLAVKVIRRTAILFFLGLMVSNDTVVDAHTLRVPGVLQRLAVSYFAVALMEVFFARADDPHTTSRWASVRDVAPFWPEWLVSLSILGLHLGLTLGLPVPGCPTGYLGPGGLHDNGSHVNCTGGAASYIDRWMFGEKHIYQHPTCKELYQTTVAHDPEGFLGTLTSIFMTFLGLQAGKILVYYPDWRSRVKRWVVWGLLTGVIAGALCGFSQNDGWIPVNKNLWSLSFVLCLASMAYILLSLCYIVIDVLQWWSGAPFIYPGMNSIAVYLCSEFLAACFPTQWVVPVTHAALLPMHLWGAAQWTLMAALMYQQNVFIAI